ncbi:MAG TPA: hypothetical protein PKD46_05075 [Aggregatilineaceae bacterium]|nr:hypothetical protein [Anaerolineae bacterium]HMM27590.1 hypothetical protein [Aggregatilineaceae bacterium]HMM27637.1 hypothetical protein [Aggregatilineaceae bacterium]
MRYIFLKTITFHLFFLLLHFAHDWLPYKGVTVIAASSESVMQHMKVAFFAWTLASLGELALRRRAWRRGFDANLLTNLLAPWAMFLWYVADALGLQPLPTVALEIAYANVVLFVAGLGLSTLGRDLASATFSRAARGAMIAFYLAFAFLLIVFTFETPWGGFFTHP